MAWSAGVISRPVEPGGEYCRDSSPTSTHIHVLPYLSCHRFPRDENTSIREIRLHMKLSRESRLHRRFVSRWPCQTVGYLHLARSQRIWYNKKRVEYVDAVLANRFPDFYSFLIPSSSPSRHFSQPRETKMTSFKCLGKSSSQVVKTCGKRNRECGKFNSRCMQSNLPVFRSFQENNSSKQRTRRKKKKPQVGNATSRICLFSKIGDAI